MSALVAPVATPLYEQMLRDGRIDLTEEEAYFPGAGLITNIVPAQMSKQELALGTRWLISRLYRPAAFSQRLRQIVQLLGPNPLLERGNGRLHNPPGRVQSARIVSRMIRAMSRRDRSFGEAIPEASALMRANPHLRDGIASVLSSWIVAHYTHVAKGSYDAELAAMPAPPFRTTYSRPLPFSCGDPPAMRHAAIAAQTVSSEEGKTG